MLHLNDDIQKATTTKIEFGLKIGRKTLHLVFFSCFIFVNQSWSFARCNNRCQYCMNQFEVYFSDGGNNIDQRTHVKIVLTAAEENLLFSLTQTKSFEKSVKTVKPHASRLRHAWVNSPPSFWVIFVKNKGKLSPNLLQKLLKKKTKKQRLRRAVSSS